MAESEINQSSTVDRTEHHAALAVGTMIGRYEVLSVLGQGGFGITYRARDAHLDRDVAIKEYLPSALAIRKGGTAVLPRSTEIAEDFVWGRQRFLEEAKTIARLGNAPAVVRVYDFLEAHGTAYVVMQLLEGETLAARLKREVRLPQAAIERIVYPLLDGLEQIHDIGFLHRDIKPANIMLSADGAPTLIDFGASRIAVGGRTQLLTAVFTPGYGAPEQATSGRQGPWTDIFGLAATLFNCVTGKPPPSVLDRALENTPASAAAATGRNYASSLLMAIDAGLALKGDQRPQSVDVWRQVFLTGAWFGSTGSEKTLLVRKKEASGPLVEFAPPWLLAAARWKNATRSPGALGALALLMIALGAGGYWTFRPHTPAVVAPATSPIALAPSNDAPPVRQTPPLPQTQNDTLRQVQPEPQKPEILKPDTVKKAEEPRPIEAQTVVPPKNEAASARPEETAKLDEQAKRYTAEQEESRLSLTSRDRQKIQVALVSLGFNSGIVDGVFGPLSRQAIAAWQQKSGAPESGFLTASQNAALLRSASSAIARWEDDQQRTSLPEKVPAKKPRSGWRWPWQ